MKKISDKPRYYQGRFQPQNPQKYRGNLNEIYLRSSWEYKFARWCDLNSNVLEYGSETIVIPYRWSVDGKVHRYFVDFYIKVQQTNGMIKKFLVEIKPHKQTIEPVIPKRKTKYFVEEVLAYTKNMDKWEAARNFCADHGMEFIVLTEFDLGIR